jgi:hypothetical protein
MGGVFGTLLNDYVIPMLGLFLLVLGAWFTWKLWLAPSADRPEAPPLTIRMAAIILGAVWGWILTSLPHPQDALHVTLGWPMPVMTLTKASGRWLELDATASIPCLVLDLAIGIGMVNALLGLLWKLRPRRRPRGRAGFFDSWRVPWSGARVGPRPWQGLAMVPARRSRHPWSARGPVQGREGRREPAEFGLEEPVALPAGRDS